MERVDSEYDCGHRNVRGGTKSGSAWILRCGHTVCNECARALTSCPVCGKPLAKAEGSHPVHDAARSGAWEVIEGLVNDGFDVEGKDEMGLTPLHIAARHGHCKAAETLLSLGAGVDKTSSNGVTPLQRAAGNGRLDVVQLFLSKGASLASGADPWRSAIHLAARANSVEVIALLLDHGVDPNTTSNDGTSALHFAAAFGNREPARFLLSRGADVRAVCQWDSGVSRTFGRNALGNPPSLLEMDGGTPLDIAAARGDRELADLLLANGAEMNILVAAGLGVTHYVEDALNRDRSLAKIRGMAGKTPLHWAARNGALEVVKLLVRFSAEINARNDRTETPMHLASYGGHISVVDLLCREGADIDATTTTGETALYLAAGRGAASVVQLLLSHGANMEANCNWSSPTALSIAAHVGDAETVELLVSRGANGLVRSRFGDALEELVPSGNEDLAKRLYVYRIGCLEKACLRSDQRILWIDDHIEDYHVPLLEFAFQIGFGLAEASSSDQALHILENPEARINLLIQDLQRPTGACLTPEDTDDGELSGLAFYSKHVRRLRPHLGCIFVTGNPTDPKLAASLSEWPACRVSPKPLDWRLLGKMVREMTGIPQLKSEE